MPDSRWYGTVTVDGIDVCSELGCFVGSFEESPPKPKTSYVEVPGMDGSYDLTESLTGYPTFQDRTTKIAFYGSTEGRSDGESLLSAAMGLLHGKQADVVLSWDDDYTRRGRMTVSKLYREPILGGFELTLRSSPYKLKQVMNVTKNSAGGDWFEFLSGDMPVIPEWTIYGSTELQQEGSNIVYRLAKGRYRLPDVVFTKGANRVWLYSDEGGGTPRTIGSVTPADIESHKNEKIGSLNWITRPDGWNVKATYEWRDF